MKHKKVPTITTRPFQLYLDLDGVFADFDGGFFKLTGKLPHQVEKNFLWKVINREERFFGELALMRDAEHLWAYTKQYQPTFLTGLPAKKSGREQKQEWVAKQFGDEWETIVLPKREKQLHSGPNKVLVDDTHLNIEQWIAKGGLGVFHTDVWDTIIQLEELRLSYDYK